tara:strand:+ start:1201 stop:1659 length:459 start_codon:yes stop_codon:yes gene_type:complete
VKNSSHAIFTLGPVCRAAAFFAFLGFLTLSSCGEGKDSSTAIMKEQTRVFNEMTAVINEVAEGGDQNEAAEKITALGGELKQLKIQLAEALSERKDEDRANVAGQSKFSEATAAFQNAQEKLFQSGRNTYELAKALTAHHNPTPMSGEGSSE